MAKARKPPLPVKGERATTTKRSYVSQTDIPRLSLSKALRLARSLCDDFARRPTVPHQLARALDLSPTASTWRVLCGASIAYGVTEGGYRAKAISLTELGKRIVAPTEEAEDAAAKVEASLRPRVAREFFQRYDRAKFPRDSIARNVLAEMGVPAQRLESTLGILKENGKFVGVIHETKTGPFVAIGAPAGPVAGERPVSSHEPGVDTEELPGDEGPEAAGVAEAPPRQRVFIAHGKNKQIVLQLKDLLVFGKFDPVVAEEHETTSKPVPDKVLDDMRSCFAGIIHVESEDELLDRGGEVHHKINENVLVEIGAAMALYRRNFILLVQQGVHLPSNLQGLYVCYYEGEKLDYDATMKLLKMFNEFK